jgi:kynureninase
VTKCEDPLHKWRTEFPILAVTNYLVSNSLGAMPRGVYDSLRAYADTWASRGIRAWGEGWWEMSVTVGDRIGALIGAPPGTVSIHPNISIATGILLSALDFSPPRNRVVIEAGIFPSVYYVLRGMLPPEAELVMVPSPDGGHTVNEERIADAIDERTRLVLMSHVLFRSAAILDVAAVAVRARQVGALSIVDGYHATGIIPVDAGAIGADFYLSGVLKWMCGGPGGVFLQARPEHLRALRPRLTGWMAHRRPFDFEVADIEYRDDAFRFLNGTPSIPCLYAMQPGIDMIQAAGVSRIREKSQRQTAMILEHAQRRGWAVRTPLEPAARGGTAVVDPPHAYGISRELIARSILVDFRKSSGIRISPHFYNSDGEVLAALAAIDEILESGAWRRHDTRRDFVT